MTRDEAIEVIMSKQAPIIGRLSKEELREIAEIDVDIWTRLGMLKLEEPKEDRKTVTEALQQCMISYGSPADFLLGMQRNGFKIVKA